MTWEEGLIALIACTLSCAILPAAARVRRLVKQTEAKFRLYAARDRIYIAAAKGWIPPESEVFQLLRTRIVDFVRNADMVGIGQYNRMSASSSIDDEASLLLFLKKLQALPEPGQRECINVMLEFYEALLTLMKLNSRLVRWAVDDRKAVKKNGLRRRLTEPRRNGAGAQVREARLVKTRIASLGAYQSKGAVAA